MELQKRIEALENALQMAGLATKEILTFDEATRFSGLSKSYMYKLTAGHRIPHFKPAGKMVFFNRKELEFWLQQNRVKTADELKAEAENYCVTGKKGGSHV